MASRIKSISKFTSLLNRSKSNATPPNASSSNAPNFENAPVDSPEGNVGRTIRLFCESGSMSNGGEEVLHLPVIVEAAESSPSAAAAAAQQIRKFLTKEWATKPHVQYNSIMLIRILSDNPGPSFTRNFDKQFVSTVKEALRNCKDGSTQQILRETLDSLEANKQYQEGMEGLIQMWRKEKGGQARLSQGYTTGSQAAPNPHNPYMYRQPTRSVGHGEEYRSSRNRQLPPPVELASRIEEARNTAKILLQLIQSTPSEEVLNNDLIREFADRCQSAQRSMQGYINCDAPPPDDETMLTLIETNEQLSLASTRYQRSVLNARKAMGVNPSPSADPTNMANGPYQPPAGPPAQSENLFGPVPPPRSPARQSTNNSAFGSREESFQPPPGPPPSMLARLGSRDEQSPNSAQPPSQAPQLPPLDQPSDPFADPVEHDQNAAPLAYTQPKAQHPANRPHSQTFSIDAEPEYAPGHSRDVSGGLAPRPGPTAYSATPSYMGRQSSAVNGLTMHGGQGSYVSEIDGHSEVGRTDGTRAGRSDSAASEDPYSVSPVESRTTQGYRY